ncbi:MAG TPA: ABC transporter permease subunit [Solirubrobacteraceae bacterium]|nr:ABC transporter permease subunit [Solirubrobacteraceae bacterium]
MDLPQVGNPPTSNRPIRLLVRLRQPWSDHRAELTLGAVSLLAGLAIAGMVVFVAVHAWPTFQHNGLSWLGSGGNLDSQLQRMTETSVHPPASAYHVRAWPVIYGTVLTTTFALVIALPLALLSSIFIVEFAPVWLRGAMIPVVRLLASVPSVIYGLIGILVLVPFVGNHLITIPEKTSVQNTVELTGGSLLVVSVILAVMITPIMVALISAALAGVPASWREGAMALGVHRLRATLAVSLKAIRPAIVAATALACARALGEVIVVSMVAGDVSFAPSFAHGPLIFLFEPLRTLGSAIVDNREAFFGGAPALSATLYAFALLLLLSAIALSLGAYLIKLPLRKYQLR